MAMRHGHRVRFEAARQWGKTPARSTNYLQRHEEARAAWYREYGRLVVDLEKAPAGQVDWDTARYFLNQGLTPQQAAERVTDAARAVNPIGMGGLRCK